MSTNSFNFSEKKKKCIEMFVKLYLMSLTCYNFLLFNILIPYFPIIFYFYKNKNNIIHISNKEFDLTLFQYYRIYYLLNYQTRVDLMLKYFDRLNVLFIDNKKYYVNKLDLKEKIEEVSDEDYLFNTFKLIKENSNLLLD